MNFLQIVQRAYREYGLAGSGPVAVTNQSGRNADVVDWVKSAHEEIQSLRDDWSFDWAQGTFSLVPGQDTYDPSADFGLTSGVRRFCTAPSSAYAYPTASGPNGRLFLGWRPWDDFRSLVVPTTQGNLPVLFTDRPDGKLQYYPMPSAAVTAVHEYVQAFQTLAANTDIPRMPSWTHMAIVWKAVMIGCGKTGNFTRFDTAEEEYEKIKTNMLNRLTPKTRIGSSFL